MDTLYKNPLETTTLKDDVWVEFGRAPAFGCLDTICELT